jgi:hypothetical protein
MGPENYQITGDLAGATSRFVEQYYLGKCRLRGDAGPRLKVSPEEKVEGDGVVAVWTSGAAGDQNPVSVASGEDFTQDSYRYHVVTLRLGSPAQPFQSLLW